ncbi:MAG: hypothetical protein MUF54_15905, partial [Polyangiaceae bacterium]|nr:hypothetical protein [Polyangiaceae bacterium]
MLEDVDLQAGDAEPGKGGEQGVAGAGEMDATSASGARGLSCSFSPEQQFTRGADAGKPNLYGQPGGILA